MHLGALNLSNLMISLWRGTMDCTPPDNKDTWTWLVLQGDVWQRHGKSVTMPYISCPASLSGHLGTSQRSLQAGTRLGLGLLYGILPNVYYSNYCKLIYGM